MKKTNSIIAAAVFAATALTANAQELVAGWDFSQFAAPNFDFSFDTNPPSQGGVLANYTFTGAASANYGLASTKGSISWTPLDFVGSTAPNKLSSFDTQAGFSSSTFNAASSYTALTNSGQLSANDYTLAATADNSLTIFADAGAASNDWFLRYAAQDSNGASVSYSYSTDGSNFTSFGGDTITTGDNGYELDLAGVLDGASAVYIQLSFSDVAGGTLNLDNVGLTASVVPEPSTYAAIAGALALGFVAYRRRRA